MELRTTFNIEPSRYKITYRDPVMFIGSCFANSIGSKMKMGRMPVIINPSGAVFNPVSVYNTIETIISGKKYGPDDLHFHDGTYLSFYHYTNFSSGNQAEVLDKINKSSEEALLFFKQVKFLFLTFGTARIYRWKKTGMIVSNCHKLPSDLFESELLNVNEIVALWSVLLEKLFSLFPKMRIVFTISPIRHLKDGAHGNQVSKSTLFLAVEELLKHPLKPQYFPAYELLMDDLRDYRFYDSDMVHPSETSINYIWDAFSNCYLDNKSINIWTEVVKLTRALNHKIGNDSSDKLIQFAEGMLKQISLIESKADYIHLTEERDYFLKLLNK